MSTYGSFEAIEEIFPGRAGSILLAKSTQTSKKEKFAVKTFKPPVSVLGANAAEQSLKRFLVRAQLQQNLGELPGSMWAPILETGRADNECFYVTRHYARSIQALIGGGVRLPAKGLHAVITGVVTGLEQIRNLASRSHGNLKPGNILIDGRGLIQPRNIALADPASDNIATAGGDAADLAAIGQLIHQIITGRDAYTGSDWSPMGAQEWAHLGPRADRWRDFCRRLVEGNDDSPTVETIRSELRKLRPPSKTLKLIPKVAAVLAMAAVAGFFTVTKNREYRHELKEYQDDVAEMQPAWNLFYPDKVKTLPAIKKFYENNEEHYAYQPVVFPLISQSTSKLHESLEVAKDGTFSVLLAKAETDLRAATTQPLPIIADGYRKFAQRLRSTSYQTLGDDQDGLLNAVNIALMQQAHIDVAIRKIGNSVDPSMVDPLQTRWINQLNEVVTGRKGSIERTNQAVVTLEKMSSEAFKTPGTTAGPQLAEFRDAALTGADASKEDLDTLINLWQSEKVRWAALDHPIHAKPVEDATTRDLPPPSREESTDAKLADLNSRGEQFAANLPEIQHEFWNIGWKAAKSDKPSFDTLEKRFEQLGGLLEFLQPPASECPIESLSSAADTAYTKSAKVVYSNALHFDALPFPSEKDIRRANANVGDLYEKINASLTDFNNQISNGADEPTLARAKKTFLSAEFMRSDPKLQDLWAGHLNTLTDRINIVSLNPADRWNMFVVPQNPVVIREKRLAILRVGFTDLSDNPANFFDACKSLKSEFDQGSKNVPIEIDNLALKNWQAALASATSLTDMGRATEKILALKALKPKDPPASPDAEYNMTLANLKQVAASATADREMLTTAMKPIIDSSELSGVRSLLNPPPASRFTGPNPDNLTPVHVDQPLSQGDEKSFKISLADKDWPDVITLNFERLHSTGTVSSTRLLSTEVSFELCQLLARACEKNSPGSWRDRVYRNSQSPIPFWKYNSSPDDPSAMTQKVDLPTGTWKDFDTSLFPDHDSDDRLRTPKSPMEFIAPAAAQVIADIIGCRLPTKLEWEQALREDKDSATPARKAGYNLRGTQWFNELNLIHQYYQENLPRSAEVLYNENFPQLDGRAFFADRSAPHWDDDYVQNELRNGKPTQDDHPLFFREVGHQPGAGRFHDLIGNVAEFVTVKNAGEIAVVGGSAISSPDVINPETAYSIKFNRVLTIKNAVYSDVGFRLAYDDPAPASLKDIEQAIGRVKYRAMPVNFTSASTPPPIGRK